MKSTVILSDGNDDKIYHNKFMPSFRKRLSGWLSSSTSVDRVKSTSPLYLAIGGSSSGTLTNSLESEMFRVKVSGKFVEPVSARSRIIVNINPTDMNSIPWGEIALFDDDAKTVSLNRCDTLGSWTTSEGFRLFASPGDAVQDNGALFCEYLTSASSVDLIYTIDLTDGASASADNATTADVNWSYAAQVDSANARTFSMPVKVGRDTGGNITKGFLQFNLAKLPSDAVFTKAVLNANVSYLSGSPALDIAPYNNNAANDVSADSASTQYTNAQGATVYLQQFSAVNTVGATSFDLGDTAVTDLNTVFAAGKKFSISLVEEGTNAGDRIDLDSVVLSLTYKRTTALGINGKSLGKDSDLVQFFLFVSDVSTISGNNIVITLSSSQTASTDEWHWTVLTSGLVAGWNYLQLPLGTAGITGNPDISHLKRFVVTAPNGLTSNGVLGIDNIRLFRPNGHLMNRVILNDKYTKDVGVGVTIQWIIDLDVGE